MKVEEVRELTKTWNEMIAGLALAEEAWEKMQPTLVELRGHRDVLPPELQKALARVNVHAKFSVFIQRFSDFWRGYGGLVEFRTTVPELPKVEEPVKVETITEPIAKTKEVKYARK